MTTVTIAPDALAVRATVDAFAFFLPDHEGKPQEALAIQPAFRVGDQPPEVVEIERNFFEESAISQRLYIFERGEAIRLQCWRDLVTTYFSKSRILLLVPPEDRVDLYCHGTLLSVIGGRSTVKGTDRPATGSFEGPAA